MSAPVIAAPRRAGPWIHALLKDYGIDTVFGIPGVHTIALYEGLAESGLRHVTPRHEQGAGFMADGYARATGRVAACFVITGPGVTNIATAMAQALADSVPMLVISSVTPRRRMGFGEGHLHQMPDQRALMSQVSAFSHTLHSLADLPKVLSRAFTLFATARPRPVHIEIPLDLWDETPPEGPAFVPPSLSGSAAPRALVARAAALLDAARQPVILCGGGAVHAADQIRRLAERLDAPVVMTTNGRGVLPGDHPLAVPCSPSLPAVRALMAASDAALAIGTEIGPTDYNMYERDAFVPPRPLLRIEIDPLQMITNAVPDVALLGGAACIVADLAEALGAGDAGRAVLGPGRAEAVRRAAIAALDAPMGAGVALLDLIAEMAPDIPLVGDSTMPVYAGNLFHASPAPARWFNSATGFGTLGYGLPAAIGAAIGRGGPAFCLTGDGGLHFTIGELASLKDSGAAVVVLVWNNASYGEIRDAMLAASVTPEGVALATPDFVALAAAFGIPAWRATGPAALRDALAAALRGGGPALIEIDEAGMVTAPRTPQFDERS